MEHIIYTIGHSTHSAKRFSELLKIHSISSVCDVRSSPYSRFNPQFNRETLIKTLEENNVSYIYLGKELGPSSDDPACYREGKARYDLIAGTERFRKGLERLKREMKTVRIAVMCAEKDPLFCHRMILVCRHLRSLDVKIRHILADGSLEENSLAERRLMKLLKIPEQNLFDRPEDLIERAYDIQAAKMAYGKGK